MTQGPIEIDIDDLMKKAEEAGVIEPEARSGIQNWLELLKESKGILKMLMELRGVQGQLGQPQLGQGGELKSNQPSPGQQMALFIAMLAQKYGDVTVNELIERLRADYGNVKISQLFGGRK